MNAGTGAVSMHHEEAAGVLRAVRVNGVELHYTDTGTDGGAVVLMHGGMGDLGSWVHQERALRTRFRVVAYSRRHSHPNRNPSVRSGAVHAIDDDVDDFLALQAALGVGPSHLVATSYGALLALAIALRAPRHVASLVLAEPPLHGWARMTPGGERLYDAFMRNVWRAAAAAFGQGEQRRAMRILSEGMWGRPVLESWSSQRIDVVMRNVVAMQALTGASDPFPDLDRRAVSGLPMPALLVQGERTSKLHRYVMDALGQVMYRAKRVEIANAGHGSPNENPEAFNAAVMPFLESLRPLPGVDR
jgi:pimeloyl-ACP methyl ester carboxylesterase